MRPWNLFYLSESPCCEATVTMSLRSPLTEWILCPNRNLQTKSWNPLFSDLKMLWMDDNMNVFASFFFFFRYSCHLTPPLCWCPKWHRVDSGNHLMTNKWAMTWKKKWESARNKLRVLKKNRRAVPLCPSVTHVSQHRCQSHSLSASIIACIIHPGEERARLNYAITVFIAIIIIFVCLRQTIPKNVLCPFSLQCASNSFNPIIS